MGIFSWIIMGLLVGILAKFLMPGDDPDGFFKTVLIGIGGAFLGGFISSFLGFGSVTGFNIGSIVIATLGGILLLFIFRKLKK